VANRNGHAKSLQPQHGNRHAVRHGLYSQRVLDERAREIVDALMELPWAQPLDVLGFEELASVVSALEAVDTALRERPRGTGRRILYEHKTRLTRELRAWLREAGATPKARSDGVVYVIKSDASRSAPRPAARPAPDTLASLQEPRRPRPRI
jgi:hypothetical protein